MCFDRNINGNRDGKFFDRDYWSLHWRKKLTLPYVVPEKIDNLATPEMISPDCISWDSYFSNQNNIVIFWIFDQNKIVNLLFILSQGHRNVWGHEDWLSYALHSNHLILQSDGPLHINFYSKVARKWLAIYRHFIFQTFH